jgi:hypothetical protein
MGKGKSGQKMNCAHARSGEGGLFPASDETTDSKSKAASAQIRRTSSSHVEYYSSVEI